MRIDLAPEADIVAAVRGAPDGSGIVVVIAFGRTPLDDAIARAAIGPLAMERAPRMRVNAVVVGADADSAAIDAAVAFLDQAASTTGQVLEIS